MDHEEYVRAKWIDVWTNKRTSEPRINMTMFLSWQAAYEFTLTREEEIRQVEEEIYLIKQAKCEWEPEGVIWKRVLLRIEAHLSDLRHGMK